MSEHLPRWLEQSSLGWKHTQRRRKRQGSFCRILLYKFAKLFCTILPQFDEEFDMIFTRFCWLILSDFIGQFWQILLYNFAEEFRRIFATFCWSNLTKNYSRIFLDESWETDVKKNEVEEDILSDLFSDCIVNGFKSDQM